MNAIRVKNFHDPAAEWMLWELGGDRDGSAIEILSACPDWVEILAPCKIEVVDRIQSLMTRFLADLDETVQDSLISALHELLMNAVEWGGGLDPAKQVRISFLRGERIVLFRIADPGRGFRLNGLAHATHGNPDVRPELVQAEREKNGLRPGGFGLTMVRAAVDEVIYNELRNDVVIIKYLDSASSRTGADSSEKQ